MSKLKYIYSLLLIIPLHSLAIDTNSESFVNGQRLFRKHCASCHNVHKELIGPMLASITKKRTEEWLITFIKNSQNVILTGDEYARFLYSQYNRTVMPSFEHLSEKEIKTILQYIEAESKVTQPPIEEELLNNMHGKELFRNHCLTCHQINSEDYGPSLGSIYRRRPTEWILKFVTNSHSVIEQGDPYADFVYEKFDKKLMPPFNFLNRQSIIDIVQYIDAASKSSPQVAGVNGYQLIIPQAKGIPSYTFTNHKPAKRPENFGVFMLVVVTVIGGIVHFFILKMLYIELAKSQK